MIEKPKSIPFVDLQAQRAVIKDEIDEAIQRVLEHGRFIMGPEVRELEHQLAEFVDARHCITVSNGTDALVVSLMALGVGPGDAVITTPFTFYATVEAIMAVGATPVFADIDLATYNICPHQIERQIQRIRTENKLRLKGIVPVDLFGLCADYNRINQLANEHDLFVLQDAAQSFGASYADQKAPAHGHIGTTSFFPAKPLGCYGDGGAVFTNDDALAELVRSIRVHGKGLDKYDNVRLGQNARLDTIQAAILLEKLKIYPGELSRREDVARRYASLIKEGSPEFVSLPNIPAGSESVWAQYTVYLDGPLKEQRKAISEQLRQQGVPSVVYYRTPSHLLEACRSLGYSAGDFPVAEMAAGGVLSLPFHPYLTEDVARHVANALLQTVNSFQTSRKS